MSDKQPHPIVPILKKALEDLVKQQELERKGLEEDKRLKKASGGFIDKPFYYDNIKFPSIVETVTKLRSGFADGGKVDDMDIGTVKYLIGLLEGSQNLTPHEAKILEDLYQDLKRMGVRAND
jgi:hypothetical protein